LSPDDSVVTRLAAEPVRERDASQAVGDQQSYDHRRHRGDARWKPPAAPPRRSRSVFWRLGDASRQYQFGTSRQTHYFRHDRTRE
jgi:hypothetical protein